MTSGKITKDDIGKTIYISNSVSPCQEWRIADVNHDDTEGTVDLFSKYTLTSSNNSLRFDSSSQYYSVSELRRYLIGTVYSGFAANIRNALDIQSVASNNVIIFDKIKCPSLDELGCNTNDVPNVITEGTIYPIFGTRQSRPNKLLICKSPDNGTACYYWTRSRIVGATSKVYYISPDYGDVGSGTWYYNSYYHAIGCIRFGKLDKKIIEELSKPDPIDILTSGKISKSYIGFPVALTNSNIECQEWIIADVNHDDTEGTVDLICKYPLGRSAFNATDIGNTYYSESYVRSFLTENVYNGFSENVKSALLNQIINNNENISDKVKCPSIYEVGVSDSAYSAYGNIYPLFGTKISTNVLSIMKDKNGNAVSYWTCSRSGSLALCIDKNGTINGYSTANFANVTGIIRFGKI